MIILAVGIEREKSYIKRGYMSLRPPPTVPVISLLVVELTDNKKTKKILLSLVAVVPANTLSLYFD